MCCGRCGSRSQPRVGLQADRAWQQAAVRRALRSPTSDRAIDLQRIFGPNAGYRSAGPNWRRNLRNNRPPPIGFGEIRTSAGQDVGALELVTRFNELRRQHPGRPLPLGGLVTTTPTGLIRYMVADPNRDRIVWQGNLARLPWINQVGPAQREAAIRNLLRRITGQGFANLPYPHGGADLIPNPVLVRPSRFDGFDDFDAMDEDAMDDDAMADHAMADRAIVDEAMRRVLQAAAPRSQA